MENINQIFNAFTNSGEEDCLQWMTGSDGYAPYKTHHGLAFKVFAIDTKDDVRVVDTGVDLNIKTPMLCIITLPWRKNGKMTVDLPVGVCRVTFALKETDPDLILGTTAGYFQLYVKQEVTLKQKILPAAMRVSLTSEQVDDDMPELVDEDV